MSTTNIPCTQCGAAMELSPTTFSVCCAGCGCWHTIDRSGDEPVATAYEDAAPAASPVAAAQPGASASEASAETWDALDQAWAAERRRHLCIEWHGATDVPRAATGVAVAIAGLAVGALLFLSAEKGATRAYVGIGAGVLGVGLGVLRLRQAQAYQEAYTRYQRRKRATRRPPPEAAAPPPLNPTDGNNLRQ
jgi:hypothetical protein